MGMVGFYYLLIGVMAIWMAIKVGRESLGMGIATFLFWPIAIIPLITNWGQRGSDIRLQGTPRFRGEDNHAVLSGLLGLSDDELARLDRDGVLSSRVPR